MRCFNQYRVRQFLVKAPLCLMDEERLRFQEKEGGWNSSIGGGAWELLTGISTSLLMTISTEHHHILKCSYLHILIFSHNHICPCFIPRISSSSSLAKTETRVGGVFIHAPPLSWRFESRHSSWNSSDPLLGWLQCFHYIRLELEWKSGGGLLMLSFTMQCVDTPG